MKYIRIYAYCNLNLGDDLFLKILCDRYKNCKFLIRASTKYDRNFEKIENLKIYKENICGKILNRISRGILKKEYVGNVFRTLDAGILIGGSLFMEDSEWKVREKKNEFLRRQFKEKFYLLGANFGPYSSNEYYEYYKKIFSTYKDVCFREEYSYEKFKGMENIRYAPDIVFGLENQNIKKGEGVVISIIKPSVRKELKTNDDIYYSNISNICKKYIEKGIRVTIISFCKAEGDEEAIQEVEKRLGRKYKIHLEKYFYRGNITEALNILNNAEYIIASRFHAMILGLVFRKKVIPLIYSDKFINVLNDIKFKSNYVDIRKKREFADYVFKSLESYEDISVETQKVNAELQFKKLDELLECK